MLDNFNPQEEIKKVSDKLDQPDKMGDLMKITLEKSVTAQIAIQTIIVSLLSTNDIVKEEVRKIITKYAEDDWSSTRNKAIRWTIIFLGFVISNAISYLVAKK